MCLCLLYLDDERIDNVSQVLDSAHHLQQGKYIKKNYLIVNVILKITYYTHKQKYYNGNLVQDFLSFITKLKFISPNFEVDSNKNVEH